ncbi:MAG: sensor histidine kinase [Candidatus Binatia bacterium]
MADEKERIASLLVKARADLDDALFEMEKLPAVSQSAVNFAAHTLGNFLSVTGGTAELLQLELADHPDPQVHKWLDALIRATELMTHTVSQLMNTAAGSEAQLRFEKLDLRRLVRQSCSGYQRAADRKQIQLIIGAAASVDVPQVWTDPVALASVLDNLLANAVKYSFPGKRIWLNIFADEAGVGCRVRDEGPGLSAEDQTRLFERGVRLTPRPTAGEVSTGYGLAVAKEWIEKLAGTIWCESQLGRGSCFFLRVPAYRQELHGTDPIARSGYWGSARPA